MSGIRITVDMSGLGYGKEEQAGHEAYLASTIGEAAVDIVEGWANVDEPDDDRARRFHRSLKESLPDSRPRMGNERV